MLEDCNKNCESVEGLINLPGAIYFECANPPLDKYRIMGLHQCRFNVSQSCAFFISVTYLSRHIFCEAFIKRYTFESCWMVWILAKCLELSIDKQ